MNIIKVTGFHILSKGDESVGMSDASWEINNDFYFDNQEELEIFRNNIKLAFENYCGKVEIKTFEELQSIIRNE